LKMINRTNPLQPSGIELFGYLLIPVGIYVFVVIAPTFFAAFFSLFNWSGGPKMTYVGIDNYLNVFRDGVFWSSFKNTMLFTFLMVIGQVGIAFIFTLFFTMKWVKFVSFHRWVMFFPNVIAPVVIGLMWQLIYNKDIGILNALLRGLGLKSLIHPWLDDPKIVIFSVAVPVIWQFVGFYLIIMMGAVASIPKDIFEVSEIDGATGIKKIRYITIPLIWDSVKICVMICVSGSFRAFDHIMVMTGGGPGRASSVVTLYNYDVSFTMMKLGYGSSMAVVILLLSLVLTIGVRALMGGKKYDR
jgi:raffinose/stachyose/melibiose transport system permease protein